tara:strand:- start:3508 stop:4173 length:666 start_codon:yes stop_codon:yes gene_type:complete
MRSTKFYRAETPDLKIANYLPNWGILSGKMPASLFTSVKKEVKEIEKNFKKSQFFGHNLAGNIKREYQLKKNHKGIENFLIKLAKEYNEAFDYVRSIKVGNADVPMIMDNAWVNFQAKHEFNPPHTHSGIYSFVGFIQIPYTTDDLKKTPGSKSNYPCAGGLSFVYNNMLGGTMDFTFQATKEDEGLFFFFPARLRHEVYPFYHSNKYRITVSGNLVLKLK